MSLRGSRLAWLVLVVAGGATACIFDKGGDYNGGGRRNVGANVEQGTDPPPSEDAGSINDEPDADSGGG